MTSHPHKVNSPPAPPAGRRFTSGVPPHFENFTLVGFFKLIGGALVFLGLCASLIYLVIAVGRSLGGDIQTSSLIQLGMALSLVSSLTALLYLLARKPRSEREALANNPVASQFSKLKLRFQLSSLGLVVLAIGGMGIAVKIFQAGKWIVIPVVAFVAIGYWALGRSLWRCPACRYRLSFLQRYRDTQAINNCPACHVRLQ